MNENLQQYARQTLKDGLAQCTEPQKMLFKRIYSHGNLELPISDVVDKMESDKLDWAMQQVQGTLIKNAKATAAI